MIKHLLILLILPVIVACTSSAPPKPTNAPSEGGGGDKGIIVGRDDSSSPPPVKVQKHPADKPNHLIPKPPNKHVVGIDTPGHEKYLHGNPSTPSNHDLSFWIERIDSGTSQKVSASTVFKSGDSIRLHVRANRPGYLYVVNRGSSGRTNFLFPTASNSSEYIDAQQTVTIPSVGDIRFDETPGEEVVWVFVSQHPLPTTDSGGGQMQADNSTAQEPHNLCGSKDLILESPDALQKSCSDGSNSGGSKDLMVENSAATAEPVTNLSLPDDLMEKGKMLSLRIVLRHK